MAQLAHLKKEAVASVRALDGRAKVTECSPKKGAARMPCLKGACRVVRACERL